jgi:hypothetical protein
MRILFTIIIFLLPYLVKADESRIRFEHHSNNKRFVLQLMTHKNKVCKYDDLYESKKRQRERFHWRVIDSLTKTELYRFPNNSGGYFIGWEVYVSDNGNSIVAVDDYSGNNEFSDSTGLIQIYDKTKLINTYHANQIFYSKKNVSHSASHTHWSFEGKIDSLNKEFELETYEMIKFRFSLETGLIITKNKHPLLNTDNLRIYGKIERTEVDTIFKIEICGMIYGKMPRDTSIKFSIFQSEKKYFNFSRYDYKAIFLKQNIYIKTDYRYENTILNNCDKSDKY